MDLYDILACPNCKTAVNRTSASALECADCGRIYPIINGVPVLLPDGSVPDAVYHEDLSVRKSYDPWVHRAVLSSLTADSITLEIGAGNMAVSLPNVIRMDVTLSPYVDVVGDAHALPFLPGTFAFIFSLAVVEHLRQPFVAAAQMHGALRNGGYVYGECNFVFPYHGWPHHYFNASKQGIEQIFKSFSCLRSGVAPYQMPSFALESVVGTYLHDLGPDDDTPGVIELKQLLHQVLSRPLRTFDSRFSDEAALRTAAGVYYLGCKREEGSMDVIPSVVQAAYENAPELRERFASVYDLGTVDNVMVWARTEGRTRLPELDAYFSSVRTFRKNDAVGDIDIMALLDELVFDEAASVESLEGQAGRPQGLIDEPQRHVARLERFAGWVKNRFTSRVYGFVRSRGRDRTRPVETPEMSPAETDSVI